MLLDNWKNGSLRYRPRAWVEQHLVPVLRIGDIVVILQADQDPIELVPKFVENTPGHPSIIM